MPTPSLPQCRKCAAGIKKTDARKGAPVYFQAARPSGAMAYMFIFYRFILRCMPGINVHGESGDQSTVIVECLPYLPSYG